MAETDHLLQPEGHSESARPRRRIAGDSIFFPMATAYAIFVLPASVFAMRGITGVLPALARVLAGLGVFESPRLHVIAAASWSSAFALLLAFLVQLRTHTTADMDAKASAHGG